MHMLVVGTHTPRIDENKLSAKKLRLSNINFHDFRHSQYQSEFLKVCLCLYVVLLCFVVFCCVFVYFSFVLFVFCCARNKLRNCLESLGDTNINNKLETLKNKTSFLSTVRAVLHMNIYIYIYTLLVYIYIYMCMHARLFT